jgi:hypothetical protein
MSWALDLHMANGETLDFTIGTSETMIVQGTIQKIHAAMIRCGVQGGALVF